MISFPNIFEKEIAKSHEKWLENTKEVKDTMLRLKQLKDTEKYSRILEISQVTYKLESRNILDKLN